jgi:nucleotide-binding universal stress UspA family protein
MKILVGIDGSKSSANAAKYAAKLATSLRTKNRVTLLSVHDDSGLKHFKRFAAKGAIEDYLREISEQDLRAAQKILDGAGVAHDMQIEYGRAADALIAVATKGKFDMIVLGSKGRSALKSFVMGSVALSVLSSSKIPVVLVQ